MNWCWILRYGVYQGENHNIFLQWEWYCCDPEPICKEAMAECLATVKPEKEQETV